MDDLKAQLYKSDEESAPHSSDETLKKGESEMSESSSRRMTPKHADEKNYFNTLDKIAMTTVQNMRNKTVITKSKKVKNLSKETQQKIEMEKKLKEQADLLEYEVKMNKRLDANIARLQEKMISLSNEQREMARNFNERQQKVKKKIAETIYSSSSDSSDTTSDEEVVKTIPKKGKCRGKCRETCIPSHQDNGIVQRDRSRSPLKRRTKDNKRDTSTSSEGSGSEHSVGEMNDKDHDQVGSMSKFTAKISCDEGLPGKGSTSKMLRSPSQYKMSTPVKICSGAHQVTIERIGLSLRESQQEFAKELLFRDKSLDDEMLERQFLWREIDKQTAWLANLLMKNGSILIITDVFTSKVGFTNASSVILRKFPTLDNMRSAFGKRPLADYKIIITQIGHADIGEKAQKFFDKYYDLLNLLRKKCHNAYFMVCSILSTLEPRSFTNDCVTYNAMLKEYYRRRSFSDFYNSWDKLCHANSVAPEFITDGKLSVTGVKIWATGLSDQIRTIPELL